MRSADYKRVITRATGVGMTANPLDSHTFSNVEKIQSEKVYHFRVEAIRQRLISEENGKAILLCDSIIANLAYDASENNYSVDFASGFVPALWMNL